MVKREVIDYKTKETRSELVPGITSLRKDIATPSSKYLLNPSGF